MTEMLLPPSPLGYVYLIHFDAPLSHARHYIGWTRDLASRIQRHAEGRGSPLLRAVTAAGIRWRVARLFKGGKSLERHLKNYHGAGRLCPYCTLDTYAATIDEVTVPCGMVCDAPPPVIATDIPF
jgi:predicted GIY-YIG superfamily endonuclease